jgi:hypothetical protein
MRGETYKTPILMATATPTFSAVLICMDMMIFQAEAARARSQKPQYTGHVSTIES